MDKKYGVYICEGCSIGESLDVAALKGVAEEEGLTVQVTPRADCNGLYVAEVSTRHIVVKELQGGTSDARFDFFINGVRAGYQDFQVFGDASEAIPAQADDHEGARTGE